MMQLEAKGSADEWLTVQFKLSGTLSNTDIEKVN